MTHAGRLAVGVAAAAALGACADAGGTTVDADATTDAPSDAAADTTDDATVVDPSGADPALTPGDYVVDPTRDGGGACAGHPLASVIAAIHAAHPELADIAEVFGPGDFDGSWIYPYVRPDGGFDLVLKRGDGDCPAGCTENAWWYFATAEGCAPHLVGHYAPTYRGPPESCLDVGTGPLWGHPPAPDPLGVCGEDGTPLDLGGTVSVRARGHLATCDATGSTPDHAVDTVITLTIAQDAGDLSRGTVTVRGLGHPRLEGRPLAATFVRRRFEATESADNLPATCGEQHSLLVAYDFEGFGARTISVIERELGDCPHECKADTSLTLEPLR